MTDIEKIKAEIDRLGIAYTSETVFSTVRSRTAKEILGKIMSFIDTISIEEPKVDLENIAAAEWDNYVRKMDGEPDNSYMLIMRSQYINLAKHFFELGIKAQKGE